MIYIPQVILAHKVVPGKGCPKIDLFKVASHLQWQREYKQLCCFILTCSFFMKRQVSFVLLNPISRLCISHRKNHKRRRQCRQFFGQLVMTNNAISMALGFLKNSSVNINNYPKNEMVSAGDTAISRHTSSMYVHQYGQIFMSGIGGRGGLRVTLDQLISSTTHHTLDTTFLKYLSGGTQGILNTKFS